MSAAQVPRIAVALTAVARAGDRNGIARLLGRLGRPGTLTAEQATADLVAILAAAATRDRVREVVAFGGMTRDQAHARFVKLRRAGVPRDEMPVDVSEGERAYQARIHQARKARATARTGSETSHAA